NARRLPAGSSRSRGAVLLETLAVFRLVPAEAAAFGRLAVTGGHRVLLALCLLALSVSRRFGVDIPRYRVGVHSLLNPGAPITGCRCSPRVRFCIRRSACGGQDRKSTRLNS